MNLLVVIALSAPLVEDPDVRAAVASYDALEYEAVLPKLDAALAREDLSPSDRELAFAYRGRALAIFQREEDAVEAFVELLSLAPEYSVSELESPLIRQAFERAQRLVELARRGTKPDVPEPEVDDRGPLGAGRPAHLEEPPGAVAEDGNEVWWWVGIGAAVVVLAGGVALAVARPWEDEVPPTTLGVWPL